MANNPGMVQLQHNSRPETILLQSMQAAAKGTISSFAWGHIHGQEIDSSLRERQQLPDSSSRLVSIWLFQQQVLHQQLFCVIQKYEMQDRSRVNPAHRAKHPGWKLQLWMSCLHLKECVSTVIVVYDLIQWKDHLKAGLPPCAPSSYCPVLSLIFQDDCGELFIINRRLGTERTEELKGQSLPGSFTDILLNTW